MTFSSPLVLGPPNAERHDFPPPHLNDQREALLWILAAATFLVFFQAYMVAPLIPRLSAVFGVSIQTMGFAVPAYLIPYGIATLLYGVLSDYIGRSRILLCSLGAFILLTACTATARSAEELILWRLVTGLGASGVVPLALALMGSVFPYEERGRPLGWLFGAMAGGAAFGSTLGVILEPVIGWRFLFVGIAVVGLLPFLLLFRHRSLLGEKPAEPQPVGEVLKGYRSLLATSRGSVTYVFVLWNAVFHSGVFTWLGVYFQRRYGLGELGIGLAVLGYGVPGFFLGPLVGRAADRFGRCWLIPSGLAISVLAAAFLAFGPSFLLAALAVTALSLGYDMTQPLFAGIVTSLGGKRGGQAMGLNVFALFTGFGLGSLFFGALLKREGFVSSLTVFAVSQLTFTLAALWLFRAERHVALPQPRAS